MSKERVIVYIDGSNFFYYCKELSIPSYPHFDFERFVNFLVGDRTLISKNYYIGGVRAKPSDKKAMKMMQKQMSFFSYLKKHQWKISKGYLLKVDNRHHEKGVDVKLALDMVLNAVDNLCDTAILVSSDTDLLPAVVQTQDRGKQVEYIGFSHKPSLAMVSKCSIKKVANRKRLKGVCCQRLKSVRNFRYTDIVIIMAIFCIVTLDRLLITSHNTGYTVLRLHSGPKLADFSFPFLMC